MKRAAVATSQVKDKLLSEGWSVPVVPCINDLNVAEPGNCLVSNSEARKAIKELKRVHALAFVSPANIVNRKE